MQRSRQLADNVRWNNSPAFLFRVQELRSNTSCVLLRSTSALGIPLLCPMFEPGIPITTAPHVSYYSAVGLDATLFPVGDEEEEYDGYTHVICEHTLEPMFDKVHSAAFYEHISNVKDPLTQCISKCIKCKCRTRKSPAVWERKVKIPESLAKKYKTAKTDAIKKMYGKMIAKRNSLRNTFCSWVLCSLLGNYTHAHPSCRPAKAEIRKLLYEIFLHQKYPEFVDALMAKCGNLINFSIREYMVYAIADMPAFQSELEKIFDVAKFKETVIQSMDGYRLYLLLQMQDETSSIWKSISEPSARTEFFEYTCNYFKSCHDKLEHYYASIDSVEREFKVRRSKIPLAPLPKEVVALPPLLPPPPPPAASDKTEEWDMFESEFFALLDENKTNNEDDVGGYSDDDEFDFTKDMYLQRHLDAFDAREKEKAKEQERKLRGINLSLFMPIRHIECMRWMVRSHIHSRSSVDLLYQPTDTLKWVITHFRLFGIEKLAAARALRLVDLIQQGHYSAIEKTNQIRNLRDTEPYVYTLIQCCIDVVAQSSKVVYMAELPRHYWENQVIAIQNRFEWTQRFNQLPINPTLFYYCSSCTSVFSLVRQFDKTSEQINIPSDNPRSPASIVDDDDNDHDEQNLKLLPSSYLGMNGDLDDRTNTRWCRTKRGTTSEMCKVKPLCCPSLLGRIIRFGDRLLCLCTNCAFPMVYDSDRCGVAETGIICSKCTNLEESRRYKTKYDLMVQLGYPPGQETASCMKCAKVLKKTSSIYLYPFNILLCSKCSSSRLANAVDRALETHGTKELMTNFIVDYIRTRDHKRSMYQCRKIAAYGYQTRNRWLAQHSSQ